MKGLEDDRRSALVGCEIEHHNFDEGCDKLQKMAERGKTGATQVLPRILLDLTKITIFSHYGVPGF